MDKVRFDTESKPAADLGGDSPEKSIFSPPRFTDKAIALNRPLQTDIKQNREKVYRPALAPWRLGSKATCAQCEFCRWHCASKRTACWHKDGDGSYCPRSGYQPKGWGPDVDQRNAAIRLQAFLEEHLEH